MKTSLVKSGMGKKENFVIETAKFVKKEVGAIERKLEDEANAIATRSTIFGISIGVVLGIVGTVVLQKVLPPTPQVPPRA